MTVEISIEKDRPFDRWKNMFKVALGQSKMTRSLFWILTYNNICRFCDNKH